MAPLTPAGARNPTIVAGPLLKNELHQENKKRPAFDHRELKRATAGNSQFARASMIVDRRLFERTPAVCGLIHFQHSAGLVAPILLTGVQERK